MGNSFVSSVGHSDGEILEGIKKLYCPKGFHVDCTYSIGKFYLNGLQPKVKIDINPQVEGVIQGDCRELPFKNNDVENIIFDPPFMFGNHGQQKNYSATKRYTMLKSFDELKSLYVDSLQEFYRVLKPKGFLIFKCQDFTDTKTTMTHCKVCNWAVKTGFYAKDIFILINKFKILNTTLTQRHARKFHSYFWVFQKI